MKDFEKYLIRISKKKYINENTPIYRVFSLQRLFEMFTDKKLTLVIPRLWKDPFENFLAKCPAQLDDKKDIVNIAPLFRNFYGQCWTLNPESDAMWRIYSHSEDGARVSTTVGRLLESIYDPQNPFSEMSYFIGAVSYKKESEIKRIFEDPKNATVITFDSTGRNQAIPLFIKREEFKHEAEVRLLYRFIEENSDKECLDKIRQFDIDPNALFNDILFDPRMDDNAFRVSKHIVSQLGFVNPINKSSLYTLPDLKIRLKSYT